MLKLEATGVESLWDEILPVEVKALPEDLAALDRLLCDPNPVVHAQRFRDPGHRLRFPLGASCTMRPRVSPVASAIRSCVQPVAAARRMRSSRSARSALGFAVGAEIRGLVVVVVVALPAAHAVRERARIGPRAAGDVPGFVAVLVVGGVRAVAVCADRRPGPLARSRAPQQPPVDQHRLSRETSPISGETARPRRTASGPGDLPSEPREPRTRKRRARESSDERTAGARRQHARPHQDVPHRRREHTRPDYTCDRETVTIPAIVLATAVPTRTAQNDVERLRQGRSPVRETRHASRRASRLRRRHPEIRSSARTQPRQRIVARRRRG